VMLDRGVRFLDFLSKGILFSRQGTAALRPSKMDEDYSLFCAAIKFFLFRKLLKLVFLLNGP